MAARNNQPADGENKQPRVAAKQGFYPRPMGGKPQQQNHKPDAPAGNANRKALGDIGNVVNVRHANGKPPAADQISRPVTRGFGSQLLRGGAQVEAEAVPADAAPKPLQTGVGADGGIAAVEKAGCAPMSTGSTKKSKNVRRRGHSLSSVLTARSKVASGLTDKPKEATLNIDGCDTEDELAVVDYVEDIYAFYKMAEASGRPLDYMASQVEINVRMRAILADWLMEVHHKFDLMPETLYLTLHIVDQYLSKETVLRKELQLVGICSMLIACKYEEIWAPEVEDFICISDRAYTRDQILGMEKKVLNCLEWNLTVPTAYVFLLRFIKASAATPTSTTTPPATPDREMEHMVFFLAELGLTQYSIAVSFPPSLLAAAAVYAARRTLDRAPAWTLALRLHTGYREDQLLPCARLLADCHAAAPKSKLKVVYAKYSNSLRGAVALKPHAADLMLRECQ